MVVCLWLKSDTVKLWNPLTIFGRPTDACDRDFFFLVVVDHFWNDWGARYKLHDGSMNQNYGKIILKRLRSAVKINDYYVQNIFCSLQILSQTVFKITEIQKRHIEVETSTYVLICELDIHLNLKNVHLLSHEYEL